MNSTGDVGLLSSPSSANSGSDPTYSSTPPPGAGTAMYFTPPPAPLSHFDSQGRIGEAFSVKWTRVNDALTSQSVQPRPRHGHRAIAYGNMMLVFGGGNEGIVEELHVFDTATNEWFQPTVKGEIPPGCAAFGMVLDGCRVLMFGGMTEYGRYSSDLHELNIPKWEWKKLKPKGPRNCQPPCARLGHSFTIIRDQVYLFGGLANDSEDLKINIPRYMNDMYVLQARLNNEQGIWDVPVTFGNPPGPRESHSAVAYISKDNRFSKLIVYGGMSGCRLGDLYMLDVDTLMWCKPEVVGATPSPRSLHTATLVADKMYVFGGWVPMLVEELKTSEKEWKCTNSLACLNVDTLTWENLHQDILDEKVPRARAGHSAVVVNTRIYIWSGRDGYRKAWNNQVCCKDLWQLEVQKPDDPGKVQLLRAGTNWLDVGWNPTAGANSYILQCVAYDVPSDPIFQSEGNSAQSPAQSLTPSGYAPAPPIMTPVPTSKPTKSVMPPVSVKEEPMSPAIVTTPSGLPSVVTPSNSMSQGQMLPTATISMATGVPTLVNSHPAQHPSSTSQQPLADLPASTSVNTLSMPSLAPSTKMSNLEQSSIVTSAVSVSPAVLPTASSLYTLPANVANTASSLLASKSISRPPTPVSMTTPAQLNAQRGVLRLRTPLQASSSRTSGNVVTSLPPGATVLKTTPGGTVLSTSSSEANAVQMSGMNALAAAAAATQKIQTPPQTMKVVQQSPGQPQVFSQVKMANMSGVLPPGVRIGSPVTTSGKPSDVKQIIVKNPGGPGGGNQIYTVVKTSQGMALANFQGSKVIQGKPGTVTTTNVVSASSMQGSPQKTANIIKWVASPGGGIPTVVSKPNIISTNQPLLGLASQGSAANSPRPTYIISKPSTTMASRPQAPQYVVVTQASAIRSIQGMAANSMAGGQTITLPTSVAGPGGSQQGVKMIMMPSGSGPPQPGQSVKIITPQGMQTASAPKTVTLATSKPTQYITSGGQIVTLPPGLLQAGGQQQISIGGKQVTLQMAGGQKLAILSNSGAPLIHSSNQDSNKPKFVMVGAGQKPIPTSSPMRLSVGGVLQPDTTTVTMGDGVVGVAAEGLVEMSGGDQNGLNMDGEQGGLKGGSMYGPWSTFDFSGSSWMKLKGGGTDSSKDLLNPPKNFTIPIFSFQTKYSWKNYLNIGLKGGAEGDGDDNVQSTTQESQSAPENQTITDGQPQPVTQMDTTQVEQQPADSTTSVVSPDDVKPEIPTTAENAMATEVPSAPSVADSSNNIVKIEDESTEQQNASSISNIEASISLAPQPIENPDNKTNVQPVSVTESSIVTATPAPPTLSSSGDIPMDTSEPSGNPATFEFQLPLQTPKSEDVKNEVGLVPPSLAVSQEQSISQQPVVSVAQGLPQTVSVQFISQPPNSQSIVSQQSITLDASPQPVSVAITSQQPVVQQQIPPPINVTSAPIVTMPLRTSFSLSNTIPATSSIATPQPVANLNSVASIAVSQSLPVRPTVPMLVQPSSPSIATSAPLLHPVPIPISVAAPPVQQQSVASRFPLPNSPLLTGQLPTDMLLGSQSPQRPAPPAPEPTVATNGTGTNQGSAVQEKVENWMDVLHTKNTSSIVRCYFTTNEKLSKLEPDIPVDKDLEFIKKKVELKPATAYKFRVAAINSCGRGPWGEITAFKTCLPGFPGAPSSIKISKSADGATIAWEPPLNTPGDILEYSVYLAVKPPANAPEPKPGISNMSFVRVYCGPSNQCNVPTGSLSQALVDTTSKPAIIFRIAAKNDKGYGPATQVRWLQESAVPNFSSSKAGAIKRSVTFSPNVSAKRGRTE